MSNDNNITMPREKKKHVCNAQQISFCQLSALSASFPNDTSDSLFFKSGEEKWSVQLQLTVCDWRGGNRQRGDFGVH